MSEPTVVVVEGQEEGEEGAAFAAGVAAATSAQAAEEATEAHAMAEGAAETAGVALGAAGEAEAVAYDARAEVEQLRGEVLGGLAELREMMGSQTAAVVVEEPVVPAPEAKATPAESAPDDTTEKSHGDEKPKSKSYGSRAWFGGGR